ncbi:SMI1/KNR4 family protein [Streptomyces sp. RKAG293]|uniref:SMI1/KNR4 family protein n=1 Tax=Streptomyces sp. RKAG293 TaxID=2893403 RepID=UPI002033278A|nr:SMI1/KNR4 family protein [Streptomyces sp. RKAG293]MCM2421329.1 SMI1/KNR4 family protein [Streptomyces sp. RKAG293]
MDAFLAELTRLVPPAATPAAKDWTSVENDIGTVLPRDYKELIGAYGGGRFDFHLWLLEPGCENRFYDLSVANDGRMDDFEDLWDLGEEKPGELEEEGSRIIAWGTTDNGEGLYWLIRPGQEPDDWTVMVNEARGPRWEHFAMTCTNFLASLLAGSVRSDILASRLPAPEHEFRPSGTFL